MAEPTFPDSANLAYVEQLYQQYLRAPDALPDRWRQYFEQLAADAQPTPRQVGPSFHPPSLFNPAGNGHAKTNGHAAAPPSQKAAQSAAAPAQVAGDAHDAQLSSLQHRVDQLIRNYRVRGHIISQVDPLGHIPDQPPELDPAYYNFTDADMDRPFTTDSIAGETNQYTLRQIIQQLRDTYCRNIGVQFMHIDNLEVRQWLQQRMEATRNTTELGRKEQLRILTRLTDAVIFEQFIQKKYIGAKSFSLEGAETLIPLLDLAFENAGAHGMREIIIGMAHRGRLNVLANILGKSPQRIFREFEDVDPHMHEGRGDVKYHLGFSGDWKTRAGDDIHLSLCFNPSHLEFVNPVAIGRTRAKQDRSGLQTRGDRSMTLLIHGDASFAGEGIVQETLNLSELDGYHTGGTMHVVVNNQLGFTTGPREGRSSRYATDIAKMLQVPVFHVNGEAPEAVAQVVKLATEFRRQWKRDVVIDMYCFRRRGHNEGDEPSYTQPQMYGQIESRESIREAYLDHLMQLGGISQEDADRIADRRTEILERELNEARSEDFVPPKTSHLEGVWKGFQGGLEAEAEDPDTGVAKDQLVKLLKKQNELPQDFNFHPKLKRLMKIKGEMASGDRPLDWAAAESLALASLATEGYRVRLSGQDSQRGTFSQRHAVMHDVEDGHTYTPLQNLSPDQAPVEIFNSPLSEQGVLGFEYGYSLDYPEGLIAWEAQFGDFVNASQVIIDQFLASAEDKWRRLSNLVMLLPHGFEGQGPEHSSARLERFLEIAAEDNIQVVNPTTPAQYFHLLRRQCVRQWRKPLIVLTPKSLLRHPRVVSHFDQLAAGRFRRVIGDDQAAQKAKQVSRVLLCSGKVYHDLLEHRDKQQRDDVAIVRMEQYYPFPTTELEAALAPYDVKTPVYWVQEEPRNMGAWPFLVQKFCTRLLGRWSFDGIFRPESASPATGSKAAHQMEQAKLVAHAFGEEVEEVG
jgi:2-oxoglutarate dehydrogenase E1 component